VSSELRPEYHHPIHLANYETHDIGLEGGEISIVMDALEDLVYPDDILALQPQRVSTDGCVLSAYLAYEYTPLDHKLWLPPCESATLSVEHTQYLGSSPVKECFKVKLESVVTGDVLGANVPPNRITTMYYLQRTAGEGRIYDGLLIRPNILGEDNPAEETITAYDCGLLFEQVTEAKVIGALSTKAWHNS